MGVLQAQAVVRSVNVGRSAASDATSTGYTGIAKVSVPAIEVRAPGPKHGGLGSGVVGDFIGDQRHHGGDRQAVYAFAREELDAWEERLSRSLPNGMFGENVTTGGLDVDAALIGERWAIGDSVVLEVCGPRTPCRTFAARMGEPTWVKRFTEVGRTGAYLAVIAPGRIAAGDGIEVISRPDHDVTVPTAFRAFMGDLEAIDAVLAAGCLGAEHAAELRDIRARRSSTESHDA